MPRSENQERLAAFEKKVHEKFGADEGTAIMRTLVEELGGHRLTVPSIQDLEREAIYTRIRAKFTGANHSELSIRFGFSIRQIRRIVNE